MSADQRTHRSRPRVLTTTAGDLNLKIPKLRQGSFFLALLERRRRVDQAVSALDCPYVFLDATNPMGRVNKEIKRRTDVVGVFPNPAALRCLAGVVLVEQHDEWEASDRRYLSEASMAVLMTMVTPKPQTIQEAISLPELTPTSSQH